MIKRDLFDKLLKQHGGWIDGDFLCFPTAHALLMFQKAVDAIAKAEGRS